MTELDEGASEHEPQTADIPQSVSDSGNFGQNSQEVLGSENLIEQQDAQLRDIEMETKRVPLVEEKKPFSILADEYDPNEAPEFYFKIQELSEKYEYIRPIRRDGNCFYRSILAAQIEHIFKNPDELKRFDTVCRGWLDRLLKLGFNEMTTSDFCEVFYDLLSDILKKNVTLEDVYMKLNQDETANYYIIFLRLVTSGYLKENAEEYAPFIDGHMSLAEFCEMEIEQMWKDVDHLAITGLVAAIGLSIRVEYLDQSAAPNGGWYYDFPPDQNSTPSTILLYRPGHYDLIYAKQ